MLFRISPIPFHPNFAGTSLALMIGVPKAMPLQTTPPTPKPRLFWLVILLVWFPLRLALLVVTVQTLYGTVHLRKEREPPELKQD